MVRYSSRDRHDYSPVGLFSVPLGIVYSAGNTLTRKNVFFYDDGFVSRYNDVTSFLPARTMKHTTIRTGSNELSP